MAGSSGRKKGQAVAAGRVARAVVPPPDELHALPIAQQRHLLGRLDYRRKFDLLIESNRTAALLDGMPADDLLLTLKSVGPEDGVSLLMEAPPELVRDVLSLDAGRPEGLDPDMVVGWFSHMIEEDRERFVELVGELDPAFLLHVLGQKVRVHAREWFELEGPEVRELDDERMLELDDIYLLELRQGGPESESVIVLLKTLLELDIDRYHELMLGLVHEDGPELACMARADLDRLLYELGFPPREKALLLFRRRTPERARELLLGRLAGSTGPERTDPRMALLRHFPTGTGDRLYLIEALGSGLAGSDRAAFERGLAGLVNGVVVAEDRFGDPERIRDAVRLCLRTASIGLESAAPGDLALAAGIVRAGLWEEMFNLGYSLLRQITLELDGLREDLKRRGWLKPPLLADADLPVLEGLERTIPVRIDPTVRRTIAWTPFATLAEVTAARDFVAARRRLYPFLEECLGIGVREVAARAAAGNAPLDLPRLFNTLFVQSYRTGQPRPEPLSPAEIVGGVDGQPSPFEIYRSDDAGIVPWVDRLAEGREVEFRRLVAGWLEEVRQAFREEISSGTGDPPRQVLDHHFWLTAGR